MFGVKVPKMTGLHDLGRLHHAELYCVSHSWNDGLSCVREILEITLSTRLAGCRLNKYSQFHQCTLHNYAARGKISPRCRGALVLKHAGSAAGGGGKLAANLRRSQTWSALDVAKNRRTSSVFARTVARPSTRALSATEPPGSLLHTQSYLRGWSSESRRHTEQWIGQNRHLCFWRIFSDFDTCIHRKRNCSDLPRRGCCVGRSRLVLAPQEDA